MVFSSIEFLFVFLPAVIACYFVAPAKLRNAVLLTASLLFYAWGGGLFLFLLLLSVASNYLLGLLAERTEGRARRACVASSVVVNLSILGGFKYANFALESFSGLAQMLGQPAIEWLPIVLPIGISFYTFQSMSYVFDVARGVAKPFRNPIDFALYVTMFPQLIAGPIVRFHEIADQLRQRRTRLLDFHEGALRFSFGLVKKVVVADSLAGIADVAFALPAEQLSAAAAWLGVLAYTLQIYFDFSAYSDMAIGLGRMFGFRLPENFDRPYSALSITDFWRRWHKTLSAWFRDYLYVPMGGSRGSGAATYRNLIVVFLLVGLWHGAKWTFIVWGAYHGALLIAERLTQRRYVDVAPHPILQRTSTALLVLVGFVTFRADSLTHAAAYYAAMLGLMGSEFSLELQAALTTRNLTVLVLGAAVFGLPRDFYWGRQIESGVAPYLSPARIGLILLALPYAGILVLSGSYSPFLYFQF